MSPDTAHGNHGASWSTRSLSDRDRHEILLLQVGRLAHRIKTIEHDYADLLAADETDLLTALHCCRVSLDRAIAAHHPMSESSGGSEGGASGDADR